MTFFNLKACLALAVILFAAGGFGVFLRRNMLQIFLSLEIMLNGVNIALVSLNRFLWPETQTGHYLYMLSIGVAAVEAAIGLSMLIAVFRNSRAVESSELRKLGDAS
ncbi:MAG: NADH-quinone oxidoreductase subunit NuoK [Leptospirales bacterium]|nr:NADH-quinone oxidoreductase subunit NuoK [Leptospirales bacterium]